MASCASKANCGCSKQTSLVRTCSLACTRKLLSRNTGLLRRTAQGYHHLLFRLLLVSLHEPLGSTAQLLVPLRVQLIPPDTFANMLMHVFHGIHSGMLSTGHTRSLASSANFQTEMYAPVVPSEFTGPLRDAYLAGHKVCVCLD